MVDFTEEARRQLMAEDAAAFDRRVKERATRLAEQHRRETSTDFPADPAACREKLELLQLRHEKLAAWRRAARLNPALTLSAAEDAELDQLAGRIHELSKHVRVLNRAAA